MKDISDFIVFSTVSVLSKGRNREKEWVREWKEKKKRGRRDWWLKWEEKYIHPFSELSSFPPASSLLSIFYSPFYLVLFWFFSSLLFSFLFFLSRGVIAISWLLLSFKPLLSYSLCLYTVSTCLILLCSTTIFFSTSISFFILPLFSLFLSLGREILLFFPSEKSDCEWNEVWRNGEENHLLSLPFFRQSFSSSSWWCCWCP